MSGFTVTSAAIKRMCSLCFTRHCRATISTSARVKQPVLSQPRLIPTTQSYIERQQHSVKEDPETIGNPVLEADAFDIKDPYAEEFTDTEYFSDGGEVLYVDHIPTNMFQKALLAVGSAGMSLYDPYRHDMIAVLGEATGLLALQNIRQKMLADPEGRQILDDRPRINSSTVDMKYLAELPEGTLGREYIDFMTRNKITADSRANVRFVDDADLAYVMQRYREVHDLHHTLLGMPTTMLGEIAVKWFEMIQTGLPMCALGAAFGPLRLRSASKYLELVQVYLPWAIKNAASSKFLLNVYYEKRWEDSFDGLRKELGLIPFYENI